MSEVFQSCLILYDPVDCSLQGSSVRGIFQARVLECVAISFSRGSSWPRDRTRVSRIVGRPFTIWATREAQWKLHLSGFLFSRTININSFALQFPYSFRGMVLIILITTVWKAWVLLLSLNSTQHLIYLSATSSSIFLDFLTT